MYKINPALREQFESLPIEVKNAILESGKIINTKEELNACQAGLLEQEGRKA